jgi:hypothetical protein
MNRTRWLFEAWQLRLKEEAAVKRINTVGESGLTAFRDILCSVLGLNLEPIAQPDPTAPTDPDRITYRWPGPGEYTPLIYAIARPDFLKSTMEKVQHLMSGEGVGEQPIQEFTEEDLIFFDELKPDTKKGVWESPEMQQQLKTYVIQKNPKDVDPRSPIQPKPTGVSPEERQQLMRERANFGPQSKRAKFEIDDDPFDVAVLGKK